MTNTVSRVLSDDTLNRIIQIESAGNPNAKAPTSSAAGLGQFITGTWLATCQKHKPSLFKMNTRDAVTAMRVGSDTAALQLEMLARFTEDNRAALGSGCTDGDLYLAHFLGLGDARRLLNAPPSDAASDHVSGAAVKANRTILSNKTCGQVRAWAQASMEQRWIKAGKTDWVRKYANGEIPAPPDVPAAVKPPPTAAPKNRAVAGTGAVIVATGAGAEIARQSAAKGASTEQIAIVIGITIAVAIAAFFVISRFFKKG